ncbi:hypothetical protein TRFO_05168 [Tritrichomonas foetus]|uniref:Glycosyltransferase RgtA/B/C/D-like domain-containing protein n=1 Tax=Tritrichomonas foetus TaxID=1144522 RepID=A0A1J4K9C6_9EUKA|nr:hypothetical protein TRFO_05168 [Tritrichomonas foetus]|eukprot:OHT07538.1 hypothetical protein TRFO_05168 [Tritrichomonas foetus]
MLWAYIVVESIWLGYEFIRLLAPFSWDQFNLIAGGIPLGFTFSTWIFFAIRYFHSLNKFIGVIGSILITATCVFLHKMNKRRYRIRPIKTEFAILFTFMMIFFYIFTDKAMLKNGRESCGTIFSDLPVHLSLISSFAYGSNNVNFKMVTPFYLGANLCYPIVPDFFSAILVACGGASLRISIAVPTLLLMIALLFALHYLFIQYTNIRYAPELGIIIFVFAGGVGWKWFFLKECRDNVNSNLSHNFCPDKETFWINSVAHFLFPQRSGAFSMPICLLVISLLIQISKSALKDLNSIILAGIMMGSLPMISAHSFIAVGLYALSICCFTFPWKNFSCWKFYIIRWGIFGSIAIAIAIPQTIWLLSGHRQNFFKVDPIWNETEKNRIFGYFSMWWESLGTFHFLAIVNVWIFMNQSQKMMYIPSIIVYVISNFIRYQPGAMDNTKVYLAAWYPIACIAVALYLIQILKYSRKLNPLIVLIVVSLFISFTFSSFVCFYKNFAYCFPIFDQSELEMGLWVMENTRSDSNIFSDGWHSCPPMSIAGRIITMGYGGWVWSHGLDYNTRYEWEKEMVKDRENYMKFERNKIRYAISKPDDRGYNMFPKPDKYSRWIPVVDIGSAQLYRLLKY